MNKFNTKLPSRQRGSMYVTVFMLLLFGSVVTFGLKVAPAYTGNAIVKSAMGTVMAKKEYKDMDLEELRRDLGRALQVNRVDDLRLDQVLIKHDAGRDYVEINYETRTKLVANIFVVVAFQNRFEKN